MISEIILITRRILMMANKIMTKGGRSRQTTF
jgi:hypothetical protein